MRIRRRVHGNRAVTDTVVVHAVQKEVVVKGPQTVHCQLYAGAIVVGRTAEAYTGARSLIGSWPQPRELREKPTVERQIDDSASVSTVPREDVSVEMRGDSPVTWVT